jgi:DnaK suppressor protein
MTNARLRIFRRQLQDLGRRLEGDVSSLTDEAFHDSGVKSSADASRIPDEYPTDRGSDTHDEEVTIGLLEQEGPRQGEIKAALDRIDDGTFGHCEHCGRAISQRRLEAIPFTRKCITCARNTEITNLQSPSDGDGLGRGRRSRNHDDSPPLGRKVRDRVVSPLED